MVRSACRLTLTAGSDSSSVTCGTRLLFIFGFRNVNQKSGRKRTRSGSRHRWDAYDDGSGQGPRFWRQWDAAITLLSYLSRGGIRSQASPLSHTRLPPASHELLLLSSPRGVGLPGFSSPARRPGTCCAALTVLRRPRPPKKENCEPEKGNSFLSPVAPRALFRFRL